VEPVPPSLDTRSEALETPNPTPTIEDGDLFGSYPSTQPPIDFSRPFDPRCPVLPARFGPYLLEARIEAGGMGVVYKARHLFNPANPSLGRVVALKMILPEKQESPQAVKRFLAEAHSAARLEYHPNIVQIHDVGEIDGVPYFSMQYISGGSLQQIVDEQYVLPPQKTAKLMKKVADAVHFAHTEANIVHRDIKPSNILLGRDTDSEQDINLDQAPESASFKNWSPKLTDFGLARNADSAMTVQGEVMGTPSYMPPEQALGNLDRIGPRSDVYSLGAVLYALLTGQPPFDAPDPQATIARLLHEAPVPPRKTVKGKATPADLEQICLKCLEKDPNRRYESARAFAEDLDRFLAGEPVQAKPPKPLSLMFRKARRKAGQLAGIVIVLVCLGVAASFLLRERRSVQEYRNALDRVVDYRERAGDVSFQPDKAWSTEAEETFNRLKVLPAETDLARKGASACYQLALVLKDRGHKRLASKAADAVRSICVGLEPRQEFVGTDRLLRAQSQLLLGLISVDRLDYRGADDHFNGALDDFDSWPDGDDALLTRARVHHARGDMFAAQGEHTSAVKAYEASIKLRQELRTRHKEILNERTRDHHNDLARGYAYAAGSYLELGDFTQAEKHFRQAEEIRRQLDQQFNDNKTRQHVARSLGNTGRLLMRQNKINEAIRPLTESMEKLQVVLQDPKGKDAEFLEDQAWADLELAEALLDKGRQPDDLDPAAIAADAEKCLKQLLESDAEHRVYRRWLARASIDRACAILHSAPQEANSLLRGAIDQLDRLPNKESDRDTLYFRAMAASLLGERNPAAGKPEVEDVYSHLDEAIKHGYSDWVQLQRDRRLRFWREKKPDQLNEFVQRLRKKQKGPVTP
jgi:serine/threonine protein kinase/tetratricopeptide (TPR) repeat protein